MRHGADEERRRWDAAMRNGADEMRGADGGAAQMRWPLLLRGAGGFPACGR